MLHNRNLTLGVSWCANGLHFINVAKDEFREPQSFTFHGGHENKFLDTKKSNDNVGVKLLNKEN